MKLTPYEWQEADIQNLVDHKGTGLVVTQVGGGKTLVAIETMLRMKSQVNLVVAPQGTHAHAWGRTLLMQSDGQAQFRRLDSTKKGKAAMADLMWGEPGWYICTPQWFARQQWKGINPDFMVFDEIHIAGNYTNATRKKLHQIKPFSRLALSGTPLRNKFENAWAIVRWLWPELMPENFYFWRLSPGLLSKYDRFAPQNRRIIGEAEPGKLVSSLPCYIYHAQRESCCKWHPEGFLANLPEPVVEIRTVAMTPKQKRFYKQMEESLVSWLTTPDSDGLTPVVAELPIVARSMLRTAALAEPSLRTVTRRRKNKDTGEIYEEEGDQLYFEEGAASPKFDELMEILEEMGDEPALVMTHSREYAGYAIDRLRREGVDCFEWSGANSQKKRDEAMDAVREGKIRVLVAQIEAVGTGTDGLQDRMSTEIWISESDDPTSNQQGKGRLDRSGQKRQVTRIYIRSEGTQDEGIYSKNLQAALNMAASLRKKAA